MVFFTLIPILLLQIVAYPRIHSDLIAANPFMSKSANITKKDEDYYDTVQYLERIVDAKTKQLNKKPERAKKQLEVKKNQLQRNIKELEKNLEAAKEEITTLKNQQKR